MGRLAGKVAYITGAARGMGRMHAVRMAEEGADIIALDLCAQVGSVPYAMATEGDLNETVRLVEKTGRRIVARIADTRSIDQQVEVLEEGIEAFGHLDIVVANAGIAGMGYSWALSEEQWQDMVDINLTGVWKTIKATVPYLINQNAGGSVILTSSVAGLRGFGLFSHYSAAKFGVVGLMNSLVNEVSGYGIRVNTINPTAVETPMQDGVRDMMTADPIFEGVTDLGSVFESMHTFPVSQVESIDLANAAVFLASDEARYVTGIPLVVDAGFLTKIG